MIMLVIVNVQSVEPLARPYLFQLLEDDAHSFSVNSLGDGSIMIAACCYEDLWVQIHRHFPFLERLTNLSRSQFEKERYARPQPEDKKKLE